MSRGLLRRARLAEIDSSLPDVIKVRDVAWSLLPDVLSANFEPTDFTPIASVCLHDATATLAECRHALFEFTAHGAFYRERKTPKEMTAIFFERYFLDDAALRLYAFGEHLANAIIFMLNVTDGDLQPYRGRHVSQQSTVANYLRKSYPRHALTAAAKQLGTSPAWQFAMTYRNRLVHDQPPSVKGLGVAYRRRLRWEVSPDGTKRRLGLTLGDPPEFDVSAISTQILAANAAAVQCAREVIESYFAILERHRIRRTPEGLEIDRRR